METELVSHYQQIASNYDSIWRQNDEFMHWITELTYERLEPKPTARLADIGGGTRLFCEYLARRANLEEPILCVDPETRMLQFASNRIGVFPVEADMEAVASGDVKLPYPELDGFFTKDAIHHVPEPKKVLSGWASLLRDGGRAVVISRPKHLDYPLFTGALDEFAARHPDPIELASGLQDSGLETSWRLCAFDLMSDRDQFVEMVESRAMSVLSTFSTKELAQGIDEIRSKYPVGPIHYRDYFAFIVGRKRL